MSYLKRVSKVKRRYPKAQTILVYFMNGDDTETRLEGRWRAKIKRNREGMGRIEYVHAWLKWRAVSSIALRFHSAITINIFIDLSSRHRERWSMNVTRDALTRACYNSGGAVQFSWAVTDRTGRRQSGHHWEMAGCCQRHGWCWLYWKKTKNIIS